MLRSSVGWELEQDMGSGGQPCEDLNGLGDSKG